MRWFFKFLKRTRWLLVIGLLVSLSSCGNQSPFTSNPPNHVVLDPHTKIASAGDARQLLSTSQNGQRLVFSSASTYARKLRVGDIVVFGVTNQTPNGLLRKVIYKGTDANGNIIVETEQATLEDALAEADIDITQPLKPSQALKPVPLSPGVYVPETSPESLDLGLQLKDLIIYDTKMETQILLTIKYAFQGKCP